MQKYLVYFKIGNCLIMYYYEIKTFMNMNLRVQKQEIG